MWSISAHDNHLSFCNSCTHALTPLDWASSSFTQACTTFSHLVVEWCTKTTLSDDNLGNFTACYLPKQQPLPQSFLNILHIHETENNTTISSHTVTHSHLSFTFIYHYLSTSTIPHLLMSPHYTTHTTTENEYPKEAWTTKAQMCNHRSEPSDHQNHADGHASITWYPKTVYIKIVIVATSKVSIKETMAKLTYNHHLVYSVRFKKRN
jgi:hypothetical protein